MKPEVYYNDNEPYVAQWLRNLIAAGHLPSGDVDERSIKDIKPSDLKGYIACHFFAGIGGWPLALKLAGWPENREVWTGSCPCQPLSVAGDMRGEDDPRHLWPDFKRLISKRRPAIVFGEQVTGSPWWLANVRSDLEALGYAVGTEPVEAASAGADHFRDRYWFVADRDGEYPSAKGLQRGGEQRGPSGAEEDYSSVVANNNNKRLQEPLGQRTNVGTQLASPARNDLRHLVDDPSVGWGEGWTESEFRSRGFAAAVASIDGRQYIECSDGKWRRLPPPRVRWLGTRIPARVAKLRAIGNAIDWRPAKAFIEGFMRCAP